MNGSPNPWPADAHAALPHRIRGANVRYRACRTSRCPGVPGTPGGGHHRARTAARAQPAFRARRPIPLEPVHKRQFARDPAEVGRARDFVAAALGGIADAELLADIRLCTSELATNAVRYGPPDRDFLVRVVTLHDTVRVEVHDTGDGCPRTRAPRHDDAHGRGLLVVAALADEWGVAERSGPGKAVWAEFALR
ncbi:hypothetical protein CXR04_26645 [Streptomyces sp. CMB-StM0423]|nr:hypothetical protein CXR04_26645 [Streptomyces sp. CMB-StM0423]